MKSNYKRYQGWCSNCDGEIVENSTRCPSCGAKNGNRKARNKSKLMKEIADRFNDTWINLSK